MPCTLGQQDFRLEEDASASPGLVGQASKLLACLGETETRFSHLCLYLYLNMHRKLQPEPEYAPAPAPAHRRAWSTSTLMTWTVSSLTPTGGRRPSPCRCQEIPFLISWKFDFLPCENIFVPQNALVSGNRAMKMAGGFLQAKKDGVDSSFQVLNHTVPY